MKKEKFSSYNPFNAFATFFKTLNYSFLFLLTSPPPPPPSLEIFFISFTNLDFFLYFQYILY